MKVLAVTLIAITAVLGATQNEELCTGKTGPIPYPDDCRAFIDCSNNATLRSCNIGDHFDNKKFICLVESKASCDAPTTGLDDDTSVPGYIIAQCEDLDQYSMLTHKDCDKFYVCNYRNTLQMNCTDRRHFSRRNQGCIHWLLADCQYLETLCIDYPAGYQMPALKCQEYYQCDGYQNAVLKSCNATEHYNVALEKCIPAKDSACVDQSADGGVITVTTPTTTLRTTPTTRSTTLRTSPTTLRTSPTTRATTPTTLATTPDKPVTGNPDLQCTGPDKDGHKFANELHSNMYFMCNGGKAISLTCTINQTFDPTVQYCSKTVK